MNNLRPSGVVFFTTLTLLLAAAQAATEEARSCCLCGSGDGSAACASPAEDKMDVVLLDLTTMLQQGEPTTCADLVTNMEQDDELVDSEGCQELQDSYSEACCSEGFDVVLEEDEGANLQVDGLYAIGLKSSSIKCSDNRYASNDVVFDTPGGACECPVCKSGDDPTGWYGAAMVVPGRGQYAGSCQELNELGKEGWLTNGFCVPFQNALGPDCCPETEDIKEWTAYSGPPSNYDEQTSTSTSSSSPPPPPSSSSSPSSSSTSSSSSPSSPSSPSGSGFFSSASMPTTSTAVMLVAVTAHCIFLAVGFPC